MLHTLCLCSVCCVCGVSLGGWCLVCLVWCLVCVGVYVYIYVWLHLCLFYNLRSCSALSSLVSLAGFSVAGYISDMYAGESIERWQSIWLFPALFAVVVTVIFVLGFKDDLADRSQAKAVEV